jgi:hypothetical protein
MAVALVAVALLSVMLIRPGLVSGSLGTIGLVRRRPGPRVSVVAAFVLGVLIGVVIILYLV